MTEDVNPYQSPESVLPTGQHHRSTRPRVLGSMVLGGVLCCLGCLGLFSLTIGALGLIGFLPLDREYDCWGEVWMSFALCLLMLMAGTRFLGIWQGK